MRCLLALVAAFVGATGCASPVAGDGASTETSAYTVEHGDRFVVSAAPDRVVLRTKVGAASFPFDAAALQGKALLIHPIARKAADGVYARATAVTEDGEQLVATTEPLTLEEMATISEDDVVRIYVDASKLNAPTIAPRTLGGGAVFDGLDFGAWVQLTRPDSISPGILFDHKITSASFSPGARVAWSREKGLEIGARVALDWSSKLTISGTASGTIFRSKSLETPSYVVTVPIGAFPVPVTIFASASVGCSATLSGPIEATVAIKASGRLGGSVAINPSRDTEPASWVSEGAWAPEASGTFDVHLEDTKAKLDASLDCELPRIELHARLAGVTGPKLAVLPIVTIADDPSFHVDVFAGLDGTVFGVSPAAQVKVFSYKP